jgi:hypothetical protein
MNNMDQWWAVENTMMNLLLLVPRCWLLMSVTVVYKCIKVIRYFLGF